MDDEEDIKKINELLNHKKQNDFKDVFFEDFIDCDNDAEYLEEQTSDDDDDENEDLELSDPIPIDVLNLYKYDPIASLRPDEKYVIDSCTDPELRELLVVNRTKNLQLIQLYKRMKDLLIECKQNIIETNNVIKDIRVNQKPGPSTGAWRLAAPYFKDKQLYSSPPNDDTIHKRNSKEMTVYDFMPLPKWTSNECEKLINGIRVNYNMNQQTEIMKKIVAINRSTEHESDKQEQLQPLQKRLKELKCNDDSEIPPLYSDENVDWMRIAETFLKDKHSHTECRNIWHIYLHPGINKSEWEEWETSKLKVLAKKYRCQNWDKIVEKLSTNRSSLATCINYFMNLHYRYKKGDFTVFEDRKILDLVNKYQMGNYIPWVKIVKHFKDRTRTQLHHRYTYYLSMNNRKKGKFSLAEDALIMICVDRFGKNFKKCAEYLPKRSMTQCKTRYDNCHQFIKKGHWTLEEDQQILNHCKEYGSKCWSLLSKTAQRTRGQLRQRYHTITQYLREHPGTPLEQLPRRAARLKYSMSYFLCVRHVADRYKYGEIPSEEQLADELRFLEQTDTKSISENSELVKKCLQETPDSLDSLDIDAQLTDFFSNYHSVSKTIQCFEEIPVFINKAVDDVERVLHVLQVDLHIPSRIHANSELDSLDTEILSVLRDRRAYKNYSNDFKINCMSEVLPPNSFNTVGLRSLLIKNIACNGKVKALREKLTDNLISEMSSMSVDSRNGFLSEMNLFYLRFHALYRWPALLSLEKPSTELDSVSKSLSFDSSERPKVTRTYSRTDRNKYNAKKPRTAQENNTVEVVDTPLKLTPVTNKSVIENLIRDKRKKLYHIEKIVQDGETKTIRKEMKLNFNHQQNIANVALISGNAKPTRNENVYKIDVSLDNENMTLNETDENSIVTILSSSSEEDDEEEFKINLNDKRDVDPLALSLGDMEVEEDNCDLQRLNIFLKKEYQPESDSDDFSDTSDVL